MNTICKNPITFILIEDNIAHAILFKKFIKSTGIDNPIVHFDKDIEIFDYLTSHDFSTPLVIIMDLHLPILNGKEIIKKIREDYSSKLLPIIILSISIDEAGNEYIKYGDCQGGLQKPIQDTKFLKTIFSLKGKYNFLESLNNRALLCKVD